MPRKVTAESTIIAQALASGRALARAVHDDPRYAPLKSYAKGVLDDAESALATLHELEDQGKIG